MTIETQIENEVMILASVGISATTLYVGDLQLKQLEEWVALINLRMPLDIVVSRPEVMGLKLYVVNSPDYLSVG